MENSRSKELREQIAELVDEYAAITFSAQPFLPGLTPVAPSGKLIGSQELKNMVELHRKSLSNR